MINNQHKSKVLLLIIGILLITNIAMIGILLQKKNPEKLNAWQERKAFITNFLQKEIGFSGEQLKAYDELSTLHHESMGVLLDNVRDSKAGNFKQLVAGNFSDSAINALTERFAASQKVIGESMFNHIRKIRQLCNPDQLPKFDSLFVNVYNKKGEKKKS